MNLIEEFNKFYMTLSCISFEDQKKINDWLKDKLNLTNNTNKNDRYDSLIKYYAEQNGQDWLLLKAQIRQESNFDPNAKSKCGAVGLAQFMPKTWLEWKDGTPGIQTGIESASKLIDARDPEDCIMAQANYMKWLSLFLKTTEIKLILAAYNWGPGSVKNLLKINPSITIDNLIKLMPAETQTYVNNISKFYLEYKNGLFTREKI